MPELHEVAERVRTATAAYRRTDVKDRFAALREELPPDDQMLLILRIDRGLSWAAAAAVMAGDGEDLGRVTTRIRKQFQRVKQRVRELAIARGLVPGEDD
jgi:RNA polymerase sigma-70 factor (ECF subfamily)